MSDGYYDDIGPGTTPIQWGDTYTYTNSAFYDPDEMPQPRSFVNPGGLSKNALRRREEQRRDMPAISVQRGGIQFPTEDERTRMKTSDDLLTEAENLRQQAERLEQIAEQRARYGEDLFKNGTVLKVDMKYRDEKTSRSRSYTYAVVKTAGRYWLSGRFFPMPATSVAPPPPSAGWTWEQFVAWLAQGDATVWQAKGLQQVL